MAVMARWGNIKFAVNSDKVFSFRDMKRSYSSRWAEHTIIGQKPRAEFQGPDLDELSIEVVLDAEMGVNPRSALSTFRKAAKNGLVAYFYVGGKKVAVNKFRLVSGTENWNEIWNKGELIRATAQLTFREYV